MKLGAVNSTWDPYLAENGLKSQTFQLKKKKKKEVETQACVWEAQTALPKRTLKHAFAQNVKRRLLY